MSIKQKIKIMLTSSVLFLIAITVLPSYAKSSESNADTDDNGFMCKCDFYKSAAIITWNQPIDSFYCDVYSQDHQRFYYSHSVGDAKKNRTFVIPLKRFDAEDFPLSAKMYFFGPNINYSDSIIINLQ